MDRAGVGDATVAIREGARSAAVDRPRIADRGCTATAGILQRAGLIQNSRGTVKILNRKSLEGAACECYGVIQHFNGGLGLK